MVFPASRVSRRTFGLAVVVGLALTACGSSGDDASMAGSTPATSVVVDVDERTADVEPVMVPTADGSELDFNSLRNKDVLLWFWAPW